MIWFCFESRLKTGFSETKIFDLLVSKGKLVLSPTESEDQVITIPEKDIIDIMLKNKKSLKIKIQTRDKIYHNIFVNKTDYEQLLGQLKEKINKKILREYEGGN